MDSRISQSKSYYSVLGIGSDASDCQIRTAYRKLAMKWHPDKCDAENQAGAKLKFQEIHEAYTVLSDGRKKTLYDKGLFNPDDDEEEIEGLSRFVNEMSEMMTEVRTGEKCEKDLSFEELQQLFVDIFSADLKAVPKNSSSLWSSSSATWQPEKKQRCQSQEFTLFSSDIRTDLRDECFCPYQSHICYTDSLDYCNGVTNGLKRKKGGAQENSSKVCGCNGDAV